MNKKQKIIIGISGGVDSSVAALILQKQDYDVEAVFMRNWEEDWADSSCSADKDFQDAKLVCDQLKIPLHLVNFSKEYWQKVFQHLLDEYAAGRTPNPDILCNKEIKFRAFLDYAKSIGAEMIATGHYARITNRNGKFCLLKGIDTNKDQSYFLYALNQNQLSKSLFPIGDLKKTEVREIAEQAGFCNCKKKDSTGICFIGEKKFKNFLNEYLLTKPGEIITTEGKVIGKHDGIMFYTLGQRKGLRVGGQKNGKEAPWYVVKKDSKNNKLIVSQDHNHPFLLAKTLTCHDVNWIINNEPVFPLICKAKIRYRQQDQDCTVTKIDDKKYQVDFVIAQWAITPGQSVVFYVDEECLGGGVIE
jgi:tRNA-specific 2-thiouridylase